MNALGWHGLEKSKHHQHQGSLVHRLGLRALSNLARFSQLEESGLVHLRGLATSRSTLHRGVWVDVQGHSAQRLMHQKIVKEEMNSWLAYLFECWIGIFP
jgi:hypothetical protein